jgi:aminopeptidase YwaD
LKKYLIVTLLYVLASNVSNAQDSLFVRKMIDTLTSPYFWGRGYTNDGMNKAAQFLASQFKSFGLQPLNGNSYLQPFSYPVNTFPGKMQVAINGKELVAGKDFIVSPDSKGVKANGTLVQKDSVNFIDVGDRIIVTLKDKLTWSVAPEVSDFTIIEVDKKAVEATPQSINAIIENKLVKNFQTANVCGLVKGTTHPDSIIVLTAHYDHLGGMGKDTYFPGANDNASGTSLLLSLAKYYATNPQPYSIAFICFAGEEAGLLGSKYFASNPLINLSTIRFLINFDLVGTGDEGITVVNATEFAKEFALLNAINDSGKYLAKINARGKAANSDHYWFTEKGVPSFFIYTLGGIKAYHDVFDKSETLPLNEYNDLFKLVAEFNKKLMDRL